MQEYQPDINFSDYWRVIKSRKGVVITFFFTTVFIVTAGSFLMKPVYRAAVSLLINMESPQVLTTTGSVALGRSDYYAYKEYLQSQREIIKSRSIARQVFEEFELGKSKAYIEAKDPIEGFLKTIKVEPVRDTRLLLLNVDNKDPELAANIANRIAEIYVDRNLSYITKSEVMNLLKNEYLKLQTKLSEHSKVYKDKHPKMIRLRQEIVQMAAKIKEEKERAIGYDAARVSSSNSVLAGLKANNITIQDRAETPVTPIKPKKRLNILLAMIVGLFGGIGLAFFFEYLDDTVKGIEDIRMLVDWPFLGNIPKITDKKMSEPERDLFVKIKPKDPVSEAYRSIRTSVLFSSTEEHPLKSIVITSPGPREGKTITLCNLGIAMANSQKKVLLVDGDMRKPRLHEVFNKKNEAGLSNFLSGQAEFTDLIRETGIDNLSFVSGGHHAPNPSELLTSHKMREFIDNAKEKFDFILFDTPPVAVVTDAVILSQTADGTIIVIESGKTNKKVLSRINQVLNNAQARIIGALLNKISANHSSYHYYSYYYGKIK
ncbi:MAG: polysaccharide biosynthesis tyrosine autokinase [Candidatus Omnitrophota bacterium]|nr:polysaccharide biosynthesis tyrosine autokinase [Candidatus Omnitrophota bacterium]